MPSRKPRVESQPDEVRSLPERRSGHDVAVSARRSFCHRRRRGNRSRPRPLRAFHSRQALSRQQLDYRSPLRADHCQGTPRRLPGQDGAGDSTCDQRNQGRGEEVRAGCGRAPSSKSAAQLAISSRCHLSKRSGRCGRSWAARTRSLSTSRWCRSLPPRRN